jgi:hypothetical protein
MQKVLFLFLLLMFSADLFAQKVPVFTYTDNMANASLRGKKLTIKGKFVAANMGRLSDYYYFIDKDGDKTIFISVQNKGDFMNDKAPKYVTEVNYYHFSKDMLKKVAFEPMDSEEGTYTIFIKDDTGNQAIPFESITEKKIKKIRSGFGEVDEDGYQLMGILMVYVGKFKSNAEFEKFKTEFLK